MLFVGLGNTIFELIDYSKKMHELLMIIREKLMIQIIVIDELNQLCKVLAVEPAPFEMVVDLGLN